MSNITINGTLILDGNISCDGDVTVTPTGLVIPVPDSDLMKSFYTPGDGNTSSNGCGRTISSTAGGVYIEGLVDGSGQGFGSNLGPGCNSTLKDSSGNFLIGYGSSHAGFGAIRLPSEPLPRPIYGNYETPLSLGSGAGHYYDPETFLDYDVYGGGALRILARSGVVQVDGTMNMNGQDGQYTGGASGGSIWIWAWIISGSGTLTANGGATTLSGGGGGAGGYISLWHEQANLFTGIASASGMAGATDGKVYKKIYEPILQEKFTGTVWNSKWWNHTGEVTIDNDIDLFSDSAGNLNPLVSSNFTMSGRDITVTADSLPVGSDVSGGSYTSFLRLYSDQDNWVSVAKRYDKVWGMACMDGDLSTYALPAAYIPYTFRISKSDSTFTFQFYDATSMAPTTLFTEVLPYLAGLSYTVQMGLEQLNPAGDETRVDYLTLDNSNIINEQIDLEGPATNTTAFDIIGGSSQMYGQDYYVSGDTLKWDASGLSAFTAPYTLVVVGYYTVTAADVAQKFVTIDPIPTVPSEVALSIIGSGSQYYGLDYVVVNEKLMWGGLGLDGLISMGDELVVEYYFNPWALDVPLSSLLSIGDQVRLIYTINVDNPVSFHSGFDNLRIYDGVIAGAETNEPMLFVDPVRGSDSSSGRQLEPLQNLFVATAWAKNGGTVVLYDGTHNPTEVVRKDLTIRGADGVRPYVTSALVQDTTGSGWEKNAIAFHACQGMVDNLALGDSSVGILITRNPDFEISNCVISGVDAGVRSINCDPVILRTQVSGATTAFDFTGCTRATVYSSVVFSCDTAVKALDTTNLIVSSNTFDNNGTGVVATGSAGVVASNNITNCPVGINLSDSTVSSYNNNFFGTPTQYGTPSDTSGNISADPLYVGIAPFEYCLSIGSPDRGTGTGAFDPYSFDFNGARRTDTSTEVPDIGAYRYIDATHTGSGWYVAGAGDDFLNSGDATSPFRTLDKAMSLADSSITIDGGHYDSYYLALRSQNISLNRLSILTTDPDYFISYFTLQADDISDGYVTLPSFVTSPSDASNIIVDVLGGPAQVYGLDYMIDFDALSWEGLALQGLLDVGDTLRVIYGLALHQKALTTLVLHSHYSNVDIGHMVIVSPSGSDSTVMGGDGTNTGGDGSWYRPYRTVQTALNHSNPGDYLILRAGEYPMFNGLDGRVLVPFKDRTSVSDGRERVEDLFAPNNFTPFGEVFSDEVPWWLEATGRSTITSNGGLLRMSYDGTNSPSAVSAFTLIGNFEVRADLRNAVDPVFFAVHSADQTVALRYDNTSYRVNVWTGGVNSEYWGVLNVPPETMDRFVIESYYLTADDIRNKGMTLGFIPDDADSTNFALNILEGGVLQDYGSDFIVTDNRVVWDGLGLDGELQAGDLVRIMYNDRSLSGPVRFWISGENEVFSVRVQESTVTTLVLADMYGDSTSWDVTFSMADPNMAVNHDNISGKAFVSDFLAVSDSITGTGLNRANNLNTEKRTVLFYKE